MNGGDREIFGCGLGMKLLSSVCKKRKINKGLK
jgi:hypothetical protein